MIRAGLGAAVKVVPWVVPCAVLATAALALGCGFRPSGDGEVPGDGGPPDAPLAADAGPDGAVAPPFCDGAARALRLCLTFDENSVVDHAGGAVPLTATSVGFGPGVVASAALLTSASVIHAAETSTLDATTALTLEAFVKVDAAPSPRAGVVDNNGEYGMWINPQLRPYCTLIGTTVTGPTIALGTWTHVACVFDGANFSIYVDGALFGMVARTAPITPSGVDGVNVGQDCTATGAGDPLVGGLDELRVWSAARTPPEIAAAAARRLP